MASFNVGSGPAVADLSADQRAAVKSYVASQQQPGGSMVGFSAQQIADALNAPATPNPAPNQLDPIPLAAVPDLHRRLLTAILGSTADVATKGLIAGAVESLRKMHEDSGQPIDRSDAAVQALIAAAVAGGVVSLQRVPALLNVPDPAIPRLIYPSWAMAHLGGAWVAAADVAAAVG